MAYVSTELRDLYVFSLLIVVLLVKPSGVLGSTIAEKVVNSGNRREQTHTTCRARG